MAVMNLSNIEFFLILGRAVFLIFSFALAAVTFTAWRRATRRQTEEVMAMSRALLERLADVDSRLNSTDRNVAQLTDRLEQPPARAGGTPTGPQSYQIAIRLARGGASAEELVSGCGLTHSEAQLIRRLHGPSRAELRQAS